MKYLISSTWITLILVAFLFLIKNIFIEVNFTTLIPSLIFFIVSIAFISFLSTENK